MAKAIIKKDETKNLNHSALSQCKTREMASPKCCFRLFLFARPESLFKQSCKPEWWLAAKMLVTNMDIAIL